MEELLFEFTISNPGIRIEGNPSDEQLVFDAVITNGSMNISLAQESDDLSLVVSFGKVFGSSGGGNDPFAVKFIEQDLTNEQKAIARENIDVYSKGETDNSIDTKIDTTIGNINALLATI